MEHLSVNVLLVEATLKSRLDKKRNLSKINYALDQVINHSMSQLSNFELEAPVLKA